MPESPDPTVYPLDHLALRGERDAPALVLKNSTLSFEALNARVGSLAKWLQSRAGRDGARVATWLPKTELACLMPLAAVRAGLVHVPINPLLKRAQVAHILADSGAVLLVSNKARLDTLEQGDTDCAVIEEAQAWGEAEQEADVLPPSSAAPDSLAAILYT
ncbi:MAG: AMP-binding protein, partial [Novosphingobium sp.]